MSKHHKHISLLISSVLIVALMSGFYLMSSFGASITSFGIARAMNLGDHVKDSLNVQKIEFTAPNENKECYDSAKKELSNMLLLEPKQIEKYNVPGKNGFSHIIYTGAYDVGEIKIKKSSENLVELLTSEEKLVFAKYADQKRTIGMNMSFKGRLGGDSFSIIEGTLNSDGMKCEFR